MRSRNIKPGFFTNEALADCQPLARILFAGLWCEADREGRLEDRPRRLKVSCLPYDDCDVDALLGELAAAGLILRYTVNGSGFIAIPTFLEHQNPHQREAASVIPAPGAAEKPHSHVDRHNLGSAKAVPSRVKAMPSTGSARLIPDSPILIPDSKELSATPPESGINGQEHPPPAEQPEAQAEPADPIVGVVVSAYHEALPDCRRWEVLTPKRRRLIRDAEKLARGVCRAQSWHYDPDEFWPAFFDRCRDDPWKAGKRGNPKNPDWKQDLSILLRDEHFARTMDEAIAAMKGAA